MNNAFEKEERYKLYRTVREILHPTISKKNISNFLSKINNLNKPSNEQENKEKDVAKKLYTETHLISLIPYVKAAIENGINESMFAEYLINFFKTENNTVCSINTIFYLKYSQLNVLLIKYDVENYFKIEADERQVKYPQFNFDIFNNLDSIFAEKERKKQKP